MLPKGFHRIRHYGLFASANRAETIARARELLGLPTPAAEEAVEIQRQLVDARPEAYRRHLAIALVNLVNTLIGMGRIETALPTALEVVELWRDLMVAAPATAAPELARSLANLSDVLMALSRTDEAVAAASEAEKLIRPFVERYPAAYRGLASYIAAHSQAAAEQAAADQAS